MLLISTTGAFLSPLFPTLGLTLGFLAMAAARFTIERSRANQAGKDRTTSQRLMVQTLLSLTEVRDAETGRHSRRTQEYTRILAQQLSGNPHYGTYLTPERIDLLASLAPLHDIGKVGIPDRLLKKPGALTAEELTEMRRHPAHGRDVIVRAERDANAHDDVILGLAKEIVYTHHEKWDGSGYPEGLRGEAIPVAGRLMALVDVYDAVTTRALYRQPMSHDDAVRFIISASGTHFDPAVVDAFLKVADRLRHFASEIELDDSMSATDLAHSVPGS
jgi:response regulator RpfG family c-di-GMP phosphodiesterase